MKKIFLFAAAAVTMAAGCQKLQEILVNPNDKPVDENSPVEIQFTTNVATVETRTRTKADGALDALTAEQTLYIYGLNRTNEGAKEIKNVPATSTADATQPAQKANLTWKDSDATFFYNGTTDKYEFYGYFVDDAAGENPVPGTDYTLSVTINGQQDILLAKTDPKADAEVKFPGKYNESDSTITVGDDVNAKKYKVYSAGSARNGVKPNLEFKHALSQFTFEVRNLGTKLVTLKGISLTTPNVATVTVAGKDQGVRVASDASPVNLNLPMTDVDLENNSSYIPARAGSSIMAFPGQKYYAVLYLDQEGLADGMVRTVTVPVKIEGDAKAGSSYKVQVTIYSLEEVDLTATLAPWERTETLVIDSEDKFDGEDDDFTSEGEGNWQPEEKLTATLTKNTATSQTYTISIPAEVNANGNYTRYTDVKAALTESDTAPTEDNSWVAVGPTKATEYKVEFKNLDKTKTYYFHLTYTIETKLVGEDKYTAASPKTVEAVETTPFAITKVYFVEENETSYNQLPAAYKEKYGDWKKYLADKDYAATHDDDLAKRFIALPWIAVECSASPEYLQIEVQKDGSAFGNEITWPGTTGLFTIAASELGEDAFEDGTYKVIANGATSADLTIDVDPKQESGN